MNKIRKTDIKKEIIPGTKPKTEFLAVVALLDGGILTFVDVKDVVTDTRTTTKYV